MSATLTRDDLRLVTATIAHGMRREQDAWRHQRRPEQTPPAADWLVWLFMGGRGAGKTRTGAEWTIASARDFALVNIIGPTADDARDIMIEGESGILAKSPRGFRPIYLPSKRRLEWPNGAKSLIFTADEPERLRGKQHMRLWGDEAGSWRYYEAYDQAMFGLRLGDDPRALFTATPRPTRIIRELLDPARRDVAVTRATTYANAANLATDYVDRIIARYEGTRLGRQELLGELLTDTPGALWTLAMLDAQRLPADAVLPTMRRIVVAVDPAATHGEDADETGIVVCGIDAMGHGYVLEDVSGRYSPDEWARVAIAALDRWQADRIIAERNNGGEMVEYTLRTVRRNVPITTIHASRGKAVRAEPVAALFEQAKVSIVGSLPALEGQLTSFVPGIGAGHDDRLDSMVYALTDLMVQVVTTFARSY